MKRINKLVILLICIISVSSLSFDTFQPTKTDNSTTGYYSLKGTTWTVMRNDSYYFTFVFISDHKLVEDGYYGEGFGGFLYTFYYSFDGRKGEIRRYDEETDGGGQKVGEFYVTTDRDGNPSTMILTAYSMEPLDGGEECFLNIQY